MLLLVLIALMPESVFNMELVVQCVRLSSNPLTHHHALLLLTSAAALYPVCVVWMFGCMGIWIYDCIGVWKYGCMIVLMYKCMGIWCVSV